MATRKFLTSVADVYGYDANDNILFVGKTLLDSSIEVSLGSAPVRGGRGNQLQYIYYHTGEMKFNLTDTQWNLQMLGETVGSDLELGNYYFEETIPMTGTSASVTKTPLAFEGSTIYGWATSPTGTVQKVTFNSGGGFSVSGSIAGNWCVRYYRSNLTSGTGLTISANMIPSVVKLVMEAQLNSADTTTNKIGMVQIVVPRVTLSGAFTLSMKADGISNTPLTGTALAYTPAGSSSDACATSPYYAKIVEVIDNTNWYDNVFDISIAGGNRTVARNSTGVLTVYAISNAGYSYLVPNSQFTFTSSSGSVTIGATTGSYTATGSVATVTAAITAASSISDSIVITIV